MYREAIRLRSSSRISIPTANGMTNSHTRNSIGAVPNNCVSPARVVDGQNQQQFGPDAEQDQSIRPELCGKNRFPIAAAQEDVDDLHHDNRRKTGRRGLQVNREQSDRGEQSAGHSSIPARTSTKKNAAMAATASSIPRKP